MELWGVLSAVGLSAFSLHPWAAALASGAHGQESSWIQPPTPQTTGMCRPHRGGADPWLLALGQGGYFQLQNLPEQRLSGVC